MVIDARVNERIRAPVVVLISDTGENKGKVNRQDALSTAREVGLDLIQVSSPGNGEPPVCKLMDYGKHKYQQSKKSKPKHESVKEIRVSYRIAQRDLDMKNKKVRDFLDKRHKVKYVMLLKGRERYLKGDAVKRFTEMLKAFEGDASWKTPNVSGSQIMTMLNPK